MRRLFAPLALLSIAATSAAACGGASGEDTGPLQAAGCEAGVRECECPLGYEGKQICRDDGSVGACSCAPVDSGVNDAPVEGGVCGDFVCNVGETCAGCPRDCGQCPKCDVSPSCTGAVAIPTSSTNLSTFNNNGQQLYTSGVGTPKPSNAANCLDPQLRIRLQKATITYNGQMTGKLDMYCVIQATDGVKSEVAMTPLMTNLGDGDVVPFQPTVSMFWGQKALQTTTQNLTITYQCLEATDNTSYQKALNAASDAAAKAGGAAGPWGWAFGLGSVAAAVAAAAIPAGGDTLYLNVQQTIDASALLELTNGKIWKIQQNGTTNAFGTRWNWTLDIESWGCADALPSPN